MSQLQTYVTPPETDLMKKVFLWLIVLDYALLAVFLYQLSSLALQGGLVISLLLVLYNSLLGCVCFSRLDEQETYIIYPMLSAMLLAFTCFLYFFFLV